MVDKASPDVGSPVLDMTTGRLAEFGGGTADRWRLRPVLGGAGWEVRPEDVWLTEPLGLPRGGSVPHPSPIRPPPGPRAGPRAGRRVR